MGNGRVQGDSFKELARKNWAAMPFSRGQWTFLMIGIGLGMLGTGGWLVRWLMQGEGIFYTDIARPFWVPDATLGWVATTDRWVWLGLDGLGAVATAWLGIVAMAIVVMRFKADRWPKINKIAKVLALVAASVALLGPIMPAWAFISGMPPEGARRLLPSVAAVEPAPAGTVAPARTVNPLPVPSGRWVVENVPATVVIARISAGGEEFDAKFTPTRGEITLDPVVLANTRGKLEVPAASIDTGVDMRNGHAAGYLEAEKHPTIGLTLVKIWDVREAAGAAEGAARSGAYSFAAMGDLSLMGKPLSVGLSGTLSVLDAAKRKELGVSAPEALLVTVSFKLAIADTTLNRKNFDADDITLTARLVLVPAAAGTAPAPAPAVPVKAP